MKRKIALRCVLGLLILMNLGMIYMFSGESAETSGETSKNVARPIAQIIVKDFETKTPQEQQSIISGLQNPIRKLAHMTEFGSLAFLIMFFLSTWKLPLLSCFEWSMLSALICATLDEWHQYLEHTGRSGNLKDVLIDCGGALIGCLIAVGCLALGRHLQKRHIRKGIRKPE